jgi:pimeloyl-ACP methyl ester carboxylesterase
VEVPPISYTRSGDVAIAYQVLGDGPVDLVFVPELSNLIWFWQHPLPAGFFRELASFSRLILLDKRGVGLSDRPRDLGPFETRMDDIRAVLDAVGSERAALFGLQSMGPPVPSVCCDLPGANGGVSHFRDPRPSTRRRPVCAGA